MPTIDDVICVVTCTIQSSNLCCVIHTGKKHIDILTKNDERKYDNLSLSFGFFCLAFMYSSTWQIICTTRLFMIYYETVFLWI